MLYGDTNARRDDSQRAHAMLGEVDDGNGAGPGDHNRDQASAPRDDRRVGTAPRRMAAVVLLRVDGIPDTRMGRVTNDYVQSILTG